MLTFCCLVPGQEKISNYLSGDPTYQLTPYCVKEYQSCLADDEVLFNTMLRATRNPVEYTFGKLKARLAILTKMIDFKLESVPIFI